MTILHLNKFYFLKGGAERYFLEVAKWQEDHGHTVVPFAMSHPQNLPTPYAKWFPSFVQTERVGYGWQAARTLARMTYGLDVQRSLSGLLQQVSPQIAHVHNIYSQLSPSVFPVLRRHRIPVVMTVEDHHLVSPSYLRWDASCGTDLMGAGVWKATKARFHKGSYLASFVQAAVFNLHRRMGLYTKFVDRFLVASESLHADLVKMGIPREKLTLLPFGIDEKKKRPVYGHRGYFLFVGRLSPEKGVETILKLARLLPHRSFKIVGRGPDEARLHRLADGLQNVQFCGFQDGRALEELYQGSIAFLMPSRFHETFGLVALEAMAAGKPVVGSAIGSLTGLIEDRASGFLVPPLDFTGWVEAVERLATDDVLRDQLGRYARALVERKYRLDQHMDRLMGIYEEVARGYWS